ncbi:hypothetical protein DH2020_043323 [Rehmannia glutinosa]|uniref:Uncharacterized protein n=1 Tax=Rehmannia glutinosa TaxID=99300 RepID=A0ABR0UJY7_REHGL
MEVLILKHLKMTLMSIEDSPEEEHCSFFYQLVLDLLSYSAASYSALARYPVSINKELVVSLENFISEQFTLMKDLVSEIKRIHILGSEILKAAQVALDAVTRLCKFGKGALAAKVNITGVIMNLISLASESLRCAAETWSSSVQEKVSLAEAKRIFFQISLSTVEHLKSASEVLAEILEPTSLHLLNSLLNSAQVKQENKCQILDWLFSNGSDMSSEAESNNSLDVIFSVKDDIRLGIARKLGWLLDIIVDEDVYCSILVLQTPTVSDTSQNHEFTYQPMFCAVLHALKAFIIMVASSPAWNEVESFLIENLFHPHFLCCEIITELWSFILRHAESDMVNDIVDKLCTILMQTSRESVLCPQSALRKTARLICTFVTYGPEFMVDRVYSCIFDSGRSQNALNVHIALLMEGFPLNFLSEKKRSIAKQRIITQYYEFLESFEDTSLRESDSGIYGAPVFALSAALQSLQVSLSDTDMKTLKFLVAIIRKYKTSSDNASKDNHRRLLGELLGIISNMKHLYSFDEMEEVILELQNLFISKPALSDSQLFTCKPNLAYFMAGLGHVELSDSDDSARSSAAWELYHMLLKERHWALVHLSVTAFGYFAAHTSCNQLWRFVPQDAALSFDLELGKEADEERFMSELKAVLEKEMACPILQATPNQIALLIREGKILKEIARNNVKCDSEDTFSDRMDIDDEKQPSKKRKFPDGICRGVELLQNGLKVMVDGLSQWQQNQHDSSEVREKFWTHFSRLEDVIAHLVSLADS